MPHPTYFMPTLYTTETSAYKFEQCQVPILSEKALTLRIPSPSTKNSCPRLSLAACIEP